MASMHVTRVFNWALSTAAAVAIDWGKGAGAGGIRSCGGSGDVNGGKEAWGRSPLYTRTDEAVRAKTCGWECPPLTVY